MDEPPAGTRFADRLASLVERRESQIVLGLDPDPARLWPGTASARPGSAARARRRRRRRALPSRRSPRPARPASRSSRSWPASSASARRAGTRSAQTCAHARATPGCSCSPTASAATSTSRAAAYGQALVGHTPTPWGDVDGPRRRRLHRQPATWAATRSSVADRRGARSPAPGVFVLVRTSNPGAADVEDLELAAGGTVWERVARLVARARRRGDRRAAATSARSSARPRPSTSQALRELMPRAPFLLPGVGAQGGRVEDLAPGVRARAAPAGLVTASRSIVRAHEAGRRRARPRRPAPRPSACASRPGRSLRARALPRALSCARGCPPRRRPHSHGRLRCRDRRRRRDRLRRSRKSSGERRRRRRRSGARDDASRREDRPPRARQAREADPQTYIVKRRRHALRDRRSRPASRVERLQALNPDVDAAGAAARRALKLRTVTRAPPRTVLAGCLAAALRCSASPPWPQRRRRRRGRAVDLGAGARS